MGTFRYYCSWQIWRASHLIAALTIRSRPVVKCGFFSLPAQPGTNFYYVRDLTEEQWLRA